jgi:diguanylate cyclase (GGDEF)-like protein
MRRGSRTPRVVSDPELRAVMPSIPAGVLSTMMVAAATVVYLLGTWDDPNRTPILLLVTVAAIGTVPFLFVPRELLLGNPVRRRAFFLSWTGVDAAIVAAAAILDGGTSSPFTVVLFLTQAFSAVFYPPRLVVVAAVMNLLALTAIAVLGEAHELTATLFEGAALLGTAMMCAWAAINAADQRRELAHASRSDPLTGCLNRLGLEERLDQEVARAQRTGAPFALVVVDLDNFKRVNDDHGHAAGDALLREIVNAMAGVVRGMDSVGRLGGDEFALVFPDAGCERTPILIERVEAAIAHLSSSSLGAACYPNEGDSTDTLMIHADRQMYRNKRRPSAPDRHDPLLTGNALV